jgi:hypothetical protein
MTVRAPRPRIIDGFVTKVEELVDNSRRRIRADKEHERLVAMGFTGTERTTRRAVRAAKLAWRAGRRHAHRPSVTEPLQAGRRHERPSYPGSAFMITVNSHQPRHATASALLCSAASQNGV